MDSRLTLYDLHREPRNTSFVPDNATLQIPLKTLNAEFICPICLGYMTKTSIVMECLHRFCHECIQKCLRLGKKECPSCRIHIPSRRSLRADPEFDAMLRCILGKLDVQLEEQETQEAQKALDRSKAFMESRKRAMEGGKQSKVSATTMMTMTMIRLGKGPERNAADRSAWLQRLNRTLHISHKDRFHYSTEQEASGVNRSC